MKYEDDDLIQFEAVGPTPLPPSEQEGYVELAGARIWYSSVGQGPAVVLLHGGMGNSANWGFQVPALLAAGYRAILIDSRGQGRSSADGGPLSYDRMAEDTLAVLDHLRIDRAAFVGWSDGAVTSLVLSEKHPDRSAGVFFFACNVDPSGAKPFVYTDIIGRCLSRHRKDFGALSPNPDGFQATSETVSHMQSTQPNYTAEDLGRVRILFWSVIGEGDEFIEQEHAAYLARSVPGGELHVLPGVSHFAPVQRPGTFNREMLAFLAKVAPVS
ncbi:MAG TPA: alpha/beta hydrolase [Devosia sp.]|nr:alpha/beta hydrolase [Devosia sp.]